MAEDELLADLNLTKKKKKTKKPFDFESLNDAVGSPTAADSSATPDGNESTLAGEKEVEPSTEELDLESFGKKKKKKKVTIMEDSGEGGEQGGGGAEDDGELSMDFADMKKKKKKKKDLKDLVEGEVEGADEEKENEEESAGDAVTAWVGSDRDYTYDELLNRVFDIMRQKNPEMASGTKQKFVMRPPQVVRIGTKKNIVCKFYGNFQNASQSTETSFGFPSFGIGYKWFY